MILNETVYVIQFESLETTVNKLFSYPQFTGNNPFPVDY